MVITESLAKGLRSAFWQYLEDENAKLFDRIEAVLARPAGDLSSPKRAAKFFRLLDEAASSPIVLHKEVTGKRKNAVWWSIYPAFDDAHPFNSWNEKAMRFDSDRVSAYPQDVQETWLTTLIGEHCVARLFQRLPWTEVPKPSDILPELRELVLLLPWYSAIDYTIVCRNTGASLTAFIPTSHGAFLGVHNPNDSGLMELRTFIGLHQMGGSQRALWEALREAHGSNPFGAYLGDFMRPGCPRMRDIIMSCQEPFLKTYNTLMTHGHFLGTEVLKLNPSLALEPLSE